MQKKNSMFNIMLIILLAILLGLSSYLIFSQKEAKVFTKSVEGKLVVSTFSSSSTGDIILYDTSDNEKVSIVKNRSVAITGDISDDGSKAVYVDALGESDAWQVYLKKADGTKEKKLTDSEYGKVNPKFVNNKSIYFLTGDSTGAIKIGKVNIDSKESIVIDKENEDRQEDCFDVRDNKIIMSSTLNSLVEKSFEENSEEDKPIEHIIYEMNSDGGNLNKIINFQASTVYSISYNKNGTKAIIGGLNVNDNKGEGIYELSLEDGKMTTILNESSLLNTNVSEFANPNIAKYSSEENLVYFTAVSRNSEEVEIAGIKCYPTAIFSYNIKEGRIEKIYDPEEPSFIFDFNIKY